MELTELISCLKTRPGIYIGKNEYFTLHDYGMFIKGYVTARDGEFENFFRRRFSVFVQNMLDEEPSESEIWFDTIYRNSKDEQEAQEMFFEYFDRFQDINWPIAPHMVNVLASHQDVTEKHLPEILRSDQDDGEWKVNVIRFLLPKFSSDFKEEFTEWQIKRIATKPTDRERYEEVDDAAKEYLKME